MLGKHLFGILRTLGFCVCVCVSLSLSPSLCNSVSLNVFFSLSLSLHLCLFVTLSLSLSLSLYTSLILLTPLTLSLSCLSVCIFVYLFLSMFVSFCLSICSSTKWETFNHGSRCCPTSCSTCWRWCWCWWPLSEAVTWSDSREIPAMLIQLISPSVTYSQVTDKSLLGWLVELTSAQKFLPHPYACCCLRQLLCIFPPSGWFSQRTN